MVIALSIMAFLIVAFLVSTFVTYRIAFYSPHKNQDDPYHVALDELGRNMITDSLKEEYSIVETKSFDGLKLKAKYYNYGDGKEVAICFHGYRSQGSADFCGGIFLMKELKQDVILIAERAHTLSEGHTITFGIKEKYDVLSWIDFAKEKFGENVKIYLYGLSMGASTVCFASGLNLPDNVKAIIADAPYHSAKCVIENTGKRMGLPKFIYKTLPSVAARIFGGFSLKDGEVVDYVKNTTKPILIFHGTADSMVPVEYSEHIYNANKEMIRREVFDNAEHCRSYMEDKERYINLVKEFLNK